jgi:hypothetical protein
MKPAIRSVTKVHIPQRRQGGVMRNIFIIIHQIKVPLVKIIGITMSIDLIKMIEVKEDGMMQIMTKMTVIKIGK